MQINKQILGLVCATALLGESYASVEYNRNTAEGEETVTGALKETTYVAGEDGLCDATVTQHSGYFNINAPNKTNEHYFYWMFESRNDPKNDPFILWMTGGPGCSGMLALLFENGPCKIDKGMNQLNNTYSWTNSANVLWIDQPTGVGFSYGDAGDYDHDELGVRTDMYYFLVEFFAAHPEYADLDFYVFGESYGGHYAPNVAYRVLEGNQEKKNPAINLKGLAVGNGLTDPAIQYKYYANMAVNNTYGVKAISHAQYEDMVKEIPECVNLINQCQNDTTVCSQAQSVCNNAQIGPYEESGLNPYDVRIKCQVPGLCYDMSAPTKFLDLDSTRKALGVTSQSATWSSCNMLVNQQFSSDWMAAQQQTVPPLLEAGIEVLIYAGDADFICNWMGNKAWTLALDWAGHDAFNTAQDRDWLVDGNKAGTVRTASNFTFLQVNGAGHMVPMDQPKNALSMIETFMSGGGF
jgi:cathepsin A (carboxypeptidase C)